MERIYNKLVRDNIPDIIRSKGEKRVKRGGFDDKIFLEKVKEGMTAG